MTNQTLPDVFAFSEGGSIALEAGTYSLTVESAQERVSFMQTFDITRDQHGLALAEALAAILAQAIDAMREDLIKGHLPKTLKLAKPTVRSNPLN